MNKEDALSDVIVELKKATEKYGRFSSCHEGYAILLEEVDELKNEVWKKPNNRSKELLHDEAMQVAAMAIRFMIDCC